MTQSDTYLAFGRPNFSQKEIDAVSRVLSSGWVGMGAETVAFEAELAGFTQASHVVTVNSCTSALFLSLIVAGVQAGDEVICPSLTWCSSANAALYLNASPVFCDVDSETLCATPADVLRCLSEKTKAVVVVHYGGKSFDVHALRAQLPAGISIIEDAAHALGAKYPNGAPVGSSGNLTCFSFYANKNLSTGDGGAIAVGDALLAAELSSLRQHGLPSDAWKRFTHREILSSGQLQVLGYKMNFTDLQSALGRVQLSRQGEFNAIRRRVAEIYSEGLASISPQIQAQAGVLDAGHARHLYVVTLPQGAHSGLRDEVLLALRAKNIGASIHYAPLHQMPLYATARNGGLTVTESVAPRLLTLPISGAMQEADAQRVISSLQDVVAVRAPS